MCLSSTLSSSYSVYASPAIGLSWLERAALFVGIVEIPLQIDKHFLFHEQDAALGAVAGLNISITTFSLLLLYGIWFADAALQRSRMIFRPLFGLPMLVYLAIVLVSATSARLPLLSLFDFALLGQAYLLFFYIANRIQTHQDVLFCILTLAAALLIQSVLIFFAAVIGIHDAQVSVGPMSLTVWEGNRHGGTMQSPVLAGSTLAMIWLPVAAAMLFIRGKWIWRFMFLATAAGLFAILMTQTRGAILTSVVGVLIIGGGMMFRGWLPKWTVLVALLLCLMSTPFLYQVYKHRVQQGDAESAASRMHLSLIALELVSSRPLMGHGAGNSHIAGQKIADQSSYRGEWYYTIHSKFLLVMVETGVVGFIAFLSVLGTGFRHGLAVWRTRDPALSALGLAIFAAFAGHAVHMTVDIFNSRTQVQMLWCMLGIAAAVYKLSRPEVFQLGPRLADRLPQIASRSGPVRGGLT